MILRWFVIANQLCKTKRSSTSAAVFLSVSSNKSNSKANMQDENWQIHWWNWWEINLKQILRYTARWGFTKGCVWLSSSTSGNFHPHPIGIPLASQCSSLPSPAWSEPSPSSWPCSSPSIHCPMWHLLLLNFSTTSSSPSPCQPSSTSPSWRSSTRCSSGSPPCSPSHLPMPSTLASTRWTQFLSWQSFFCAGSCAWGCPPANRSPCSWNGRLPALARRTRRGFCFLWSVFVWIWCQLFWRELLSSLFSACVKVMPAAFTVVLTCACLRISC